ncbi:unnamed protein product [Camellia sinensis]
MAVSSSPQLVRLPPIFPLLLTFQPKPPIHDDDHNRLSSTLPVKSNNGLSSDQEREFLEQYGLNLDDFLSKPSPKTRRKELRKTGRGKQVPPEEPKPPRETHKLLQAPAYIGEITPKNSRGAFTALMLTCGMSLVYFVGNVVTWRTLAIIGTIPSLAEVIGLFFIPESPRWLVKDYLELAQQLPKSSFIDMFQWKYAHSLTIGVGIVLLAIFGGTVARLPLALQYWLLFRFHFPFSILGVVLMDKSGRRPLWMISVAGTCMGNILVGLGFLLKDFDQKKEITAVLVLAGILVYGSSFSIGISSTPWIILSEMLPINIKGSAGSFITFLVWASSWIVAYTFNFVLGGTAKRKKLLSPKGLDVRPMMEVVKGAAFDILQAAGGCLASLRPGHWLDLYSGTGSVGIEALSRGCSEAESAA